jgi:hypothetical protein
VRRTGAAAFRATTSTWIGEEFRCQASRRTAQTPFRVVGIYDDVREGYIRLRDRSSAQVAVAADLGMPPRKRDDAARDHQRIVRIVGGQLRKFPDS